VKEYFRCFFLLKQDYISMQLWWFVFFLAVVREKTPHLKPFLHKIEYFAKAGSGQTYETLKKTRVYF
jgi:hypothetical protein